MMTTMALMRVSELFGPTFQGEGPSTGKLALFLRLAGCNLDCAWCDTPYSWDWTRFDPETEVEAMSGDRVLRELAAKWAGVGQVARLDPHVVVTGGEPILQASRICELVMARPSWSWEIETNGTRPVPLWLHGQAGLMVQVNVSPKLASSGCSPDRAAMHDSWAVLAHQRFGAGRRPVVFKFVVAGDEDVAGVRAWLDEFDVPRQLVYLMPEGETFNQAAYVFAADAALGLGVNLTGRLHTLVWPKERGR